MWAENNKSLKAQNKQWQQIYAVRQMWAYADCQQLLLKQNTRGTRGSHTPQHILHLESHIQQILTENRYIDGKNGWSEDELNSTQLQKKSRFSFSFFYPDSIFSQFRILVLGCWDRVSNIVLERDEGIN